MLTIISDQTVKDFFSDAFENMHKSIQQIILLDEEDWYLLKSYLKSVVFKKGDFFLRESEFCNHIAFLNKGIARVFYVVDGKEITSYFNTSERNVFVCSFTSFLSRKQSFENVHFLEDSELLMMDYTQLQELYDKSPNIQKLGRLMAEQNYVLSMERIYSLQHSPALDRYNNMLKIYPGLLNQIPHHYIASYIGVTPESLSRIRKDSVKTRF